MSRLFIDKKEFEREHNKRCTAANVKAEYPEYVALRRVGGGYILFEFCSDYDFWMQQK